MTWCQLFQEVVGFTGEGLFVFGLLHGPWPLLFIGPVLLVIAIFVVDCLNTTNGQNAP
jgi:hypothetical protein